MWSYVIVLYHAILYCVTFCDLMTFCVFLQEFVTSCEFIFSSLCYLYSLLLISKSSLIRIKRSSLKIASCVVASMVIYTRSNESIKVAFNKLLKATVKPMQPSFKCSKCFVNVQISICTWIDTGSVESPFLELIGHFVDFWMEHFAISGTTEPLPPPPTCIVRLGKTTSTIVDVCRSHACNCY